MGQKNYFDLFIEYLKIERKSSLNTVSAYEKDVLQFINYSNKRKIQYLNADKSFIVEYRDLLLQNGLSKSSVSRAICAVRSFYKFLQKNGVRNENPANDISNEKAKSDRKFFEVLTNEEITLLMKQPDLNDPKGIRDKAMLEVLYATGMKVSELISLNLNDYFPQSNAIKCYGGTKKNEPRVLYLYPVALKSLDAYIKNSRNYFVGQNENALFVNLNGERITRQGLWKILKSYVEKAAIKKTITPQTLRHSFATHLLENGAQLDDIKDLLGHSDISSTQVYAKYLKNKVSGTVLKFHPRS